MVLKREKKNKEELRIKQEKEASEKEAKEKKEMEKKVKESKKHKLNLKLCQLQSQPKKLMN